jgi:hypothetical protein
MNRGTHKTALAALLAALVLAACRSNPVSSGIDLLTTLSWRVQGAFVPKPPEQHCLASLIRRYDVLPGVVADQVAGVAGTDPASVDWEAVFEEAAHDAGVRKPGVTTVAAEGDPGVFLIAVDWCYGLTGYDLYVVDLAGDVWLVGEGSVSTAPPDVRWLGDAWAVITDFGCYWQPLVRLRLVAESDGGWAQIYDSEQPESGCEALMWGLQEIPELVFEDGYRLLTVKWGGKSGVIVKVYEWQDGRYVLVEEGKLDDEPGNP